MLLFQQHELLPLLGSLAEPAFAFNDDTRHTRPEVREVLRLPGGDEILNPFPFVIELDAGFGKLGADALFKVVTIPRSQQDWLLRHS